MFNSRAPICVHCFKIVCEEGIDWVSKRVQEELVTKHMASSATA